MGQYTQKGSRIGVVGRIQARSYDGNDGVKRWLTEVVVEELEFLESKKDGNSNSANAQHQSNSEPMSVMGLDEDFHLMADDDDCPF